MGMTEIDPGPEADRQFTITWTGRALNLDDVGFDQSIPTLQIPTASTANGTSYDDTTTVTLNVIEPQLTITHTWRNVTRGDSGFSTTPSAGDAGDIYEHRLLLKMPAVLPVAQHLIFTSSLILLKILRMTPKYPYDLMALQSAALMPIQPPSPAIFYGAGKVAAQMTSIFLLAHRSKLFSAPPSMKTLHPTHYSAGAPPPFGPALMTMPKRRQQSAMA